jgi:hypothetical protein
MSGHPERARAHITGIQQLVSARGGMSNLNPLTQKLVRWYAYFILDSKSGFNIRTTILCNFGQLSPNLLTKLGSLCL